MYVPFSEEVTLTLNSGGGVVQGIVRVGADKGKISGWCVNSSLVVVEPQIRVYSRIGQTTEGGYLIATFTPNPPGANEAEAGQFSTAVPWVNRDARDNDGDKSNASAEDFYLVANNSVTTVLTVTIHGEKWIPEP